MCNPLDQADAEDADTGLEDLTGVDYDEGMVDKRGAGDRCTMMMMMMMMMILFLILLNTIPLQNKPKIHSVFVCVCMYVKSPPEGDTTSLPDGRRDCELSTSPLPNARRHTIFSMVAY